MNYRAIERLLYKYTDAWTKAEGSFPAETRVDAENAYSILNDHYKNVDQHHIDAQRASVDGTDFKIKFKDPKLDEKLKYYPDLSPEAANAGPMGSGLGESYSTALEYLVVDLNEAIEKHDQLNPHIFNEHEELRSEVKDKISGIVTKFIESLKEDDINIEVKDVVLVGSNCSFNYTEDSDIDVHLIADMSNFKDDDLALKLYNAYRRIFNSKYDPMIRGHEVEVFVDQDENHAKSNGVYSLNSGWIKKPDSKIIPEVNMNDVDNALEPWRDRAEEIFANPSIDDIDKIISDIYVLRQESILKDGEYGLGNLVFKEFRNLKYLKKLKDLKVQLETEEMSLEDDAMQEENSMEINEEQSFDIDWLNYGMDPVGDDKAPEEEDNFYPDDLPFESDPITESTKISYKLIAKDGLTSLRKYKHVPEVKEFIDRIDSLAHDNKTTQFKESVDSNEDHFKKFLIKYFDGNFREAPSTLTPRNMDVLMNLMGVNYEYNSDKYDENPESDYGKLYKSYEKFIDDLRAGNKSLREELTPIIESVTSDIVLANRSMVNDIYGKLSQGVNADVPENIRKVFEENSGNVQLTVNEKYIYLSGLIKGYSIGATIALSDLRADLKRLAEDIVVAIVKTGGND